MALNPSTENMNDFLADKCEATKAKYAAELAHAGEPWRKPLDYRYAESLVYFGLLERMTRTFQRGRTVGSKTWFRKAPKSLLRVSKSAFQQTEMAL